MAVSTDRAEQVFGDAQTLWEFHCVGSVSCGPADVGIGLGSHDPGVPRHTANLFHVGAFPLVVFTGANAPSTLDRWPDREAVGFRREAISLGVPASAILIEPNARNTVENIVMTRELLSWREVEVRTAVLISRPYQQRYALGVAAKLWPGVVFTGSAEATPMQQYMTQIGSSDKVINMMVGDLQRIAVTGEQGIAVVQDIPGAVLEAYWRLVDAGYTARLIAGEALSTQRR